MNFMNNFDKQLKRIKEIISEVNYNYHAGDLGDDLDNLEPHVSDNIFRMAGRDTGHFGSGLYFSTYRLRDKADYDKDYGKYSNFRDQSSNLIKVKNSVYRVDFDIYKNLYRVSSNKHGEVLFKTLKQLNGIFYSYDHGERELSRWYLVILNNFKHLGLRLPGYREFFKMLKEAKVVNDSRWSKDGVDKNAYIASFSTRIMEWNGYNGINVSGLSDYDNTLHGSVIYDTKKIGGELKPVDFDSFIGYKDGVASSGYDDLVAKVLSGEFLSEEGIKELNKLPLDKSSILIKRYRNWLTHQFGILRVELKRIFLKSLHNNILGNEKMMGDVTKYDLQFLIDNDMRRIIMDSRIKKGGESLLSYMLYEFRYDDDRIKKLMSWVDRDLDDNEKESFEMAKETYEKYNK